MGVSHEAARSYFFLIGDYIYEPQTKGFSRDPIRDCWDSLAAYLHFAGRTGDAMIGHCSGLSVGKLQRTPKRFQFPGVLRTLQSWDKTDCYLCRAHSCTPLREPSKGDLAKLAIIEGLGGELAPREKMSIRRGRGKNSKCTAEQLEALANCTAEQLEVLAKCSGKEARWALSHGWVTDVKADEVRVGDVIHTEQMAPFPVASVSGRKRVTFRNAVGKTLRYDRDDLVAVRAPRGAKKEKA